jgi:anti-sigma factor RsiW
MTCRELTELLTDYVSGELPAEDLRRADEHLAGCPDCAAYRETYETTVRLGSLAFRRADGRARADAPEELVAAILTARRRERGRPGGKSKGRL